MNARLADRNFGDCEIQAITFLNGSAYLKIFDPHETAFFTLVFRSVGILLFATNHTQNVIDTIRLFDNLDALRNDPDAFGFFKRMDHPHSREDSSMRFAYVVPVAGGETLISFTDVEMEE